MISDDPKLLEAMLRDWKQSSAFKETSGELIEIYEQFSQDLRAKGIAQCYQQGVRGVTAVHGADLNPTHSPLKKLSFNKEIEDSKKEFLVASLKYLGEHREAPFLPYDLSLQDLDESAFRVCELYGNSCGAVPLGELEVSAEHYPEYLFEVEGRRYSYNFLVSYIHYAYCCKHVDFQTIENVVEIGPGFGRQVELFRRLYPKIKFYLIDLGPTLYMCHQYLRAHFPESMVSYSSLANQTAIRLGKEGEIATIGNWDLEKISPEGKTLSFNTAVFCLMSPSTVSRYLGCIKNWADFVYLMEPRTNLCAKIYNMPEAPSFEVYQGLLNATHRLVDRTPAFRPLSLRRDFGGFDMMLWEKQEAK